jgi:transposase
VDLAKSVFEVVVADQNWKVIDRARLSRPQFERWFHNRTVGGGSLVPDFSAPLP